MHLLNTFATPTTLLVQLVAGLLVTVGTASAQEIGKGVVGSWTLVSHMVTYSGSTFDAHAAHLQQRPCAAKIRYHINADATYRLDASATVCDEKFKSIQEKLYAKMKWKVDGSVFTMSATNFAVGQSYKVSLSGNRMTWVGTEGQGTLVFQK